MTLCTNKSTKKTKNKIKLILKQPPISDKENERLEGISFDNQRLM